MRGYTAKLRRPKNSIPIVQLHFKFMSSVEMYWCLCSVNTRFMCFSWSSICLIYRLMPQASLVFVSLLSAHKANYDHRCLAPLLCGRGRHVSCLAAVHWHSRAVAWGSPDLPRWDFHCPCMRAGPCQADHEGIFSLVTTRPYIFFSVQDLDFSHRIKH